MSHTNSDKCPGVIISKIHKETVLSAVKDVNSLNPGGPEGEGRGTGDGRLFPADSQQSAHFLRTETAKLAQESVKRGITKELNYHVQKLIRASSGISLN